MARVPIEEVLRDNPDWELTERRATLVADRRVVVEEQIAGAAGEGERPVLVSFLGSDATGRVFHACRDSEEALRVAALVADRMVGSRER